MPAITSVQVTKANNFFFNRLTQKISFLGLSQMEVVMTIYISFSLTKLLVWVKCQWQPYFTHQYLHFFFHWNNCLTANFHTFGLIRKWTDLFTWMYLHRYICVSWLSFFFFALKLFHCSVASSFILPWPPRTCCRYVSHPLRRKRNLQLSLCVWFPSHCIIPVGLSILLQVCRW